MKYKLVIFDMDGTTLDTLHDITLSMNRALEDEGLPPITDEESIRMQGWGVNIFTSKACPDGTPEDVRLRVREGFRKYYEASPKENTMPYEGIVELLKDLKARGYKLAVSSNKLDPAVQELAEKHFPGMFDFAVGFKDGLPRKPDPASVYMAEEALGAEPSETLYVGDSETDVETAANGGVDCLICLWGFRTRDELEKAGAKVFCEKPSEILDYVEGTKQNFSETTQ